jgi:polar amino acid transport system substrate-binding protein
LKRIILIGFFLLSNKTLFAEKIDFIISYENKNQSPYYRGSGTLTPLKNPGITVEIMEIVAKKLNLNLKYKRAPWKRVLINLKTNKVQGIFKASFKEERKEIGHYPLKGDKIDTRRSIERLSYSLYGLKNNKIWDGKNLKSIKGTIGALRGYAIVKDLTNKGLLVQEVDSTKSLFQMLKSGRIDYAAHLSIVGNNTIKNNKLFKQIKEFSPPLNVKNQYLMISKKFYKNNKVLSEKIWDTIYEVRLKYYENLWKKYEKVK